MSCGTRTTAPARSLPPTTWFPPRSRIYKVSFSRRKQPPRLLPTPRGQLLKKWLTDPLLNWNPALLTKLLDILGTQDDTEFQQKVDNNQTFLLNLRIQYHDQVLTADLSALPAFALGVFPPDSLGSQISYDPANRRLQLIGIMSATDQVLLNSPFCRCSISSGSGPTLSGCATNKQRGC